MAQSPWIEAAKAELRRQAGARREALPAGMRAAAAQAIAARPFPIPLALKTTVSGFMPIGSEINPIPLMRNLAVLGAQLPLPAVAGRRKPPTIRAICVRQSIALEPCVVPSPLPTRPGHSPHVLSSCV